MFRFDANESDSSPPPPFTDRATTELETIFGSSPSSPTSFPMIDEAEKSSNVPHNGSATTRSVWLGADGFGVCFEMGKKCYRMHALYISSLWWCHPHCGPYLGNNFLVLCQIDKVWCISIVELFSRRRWRLTSAKLSIKFGYCPWCTVPIVLYFHKHNSLPLSRYEPSSPIFSHIYMNENLPHDINNLSR